jgi:hypothetical protein
MPAMVLSEEAQEAVDLLNGKAIEDARAIGREKGPGPRPITIRDPKRKPPPTLEAVSFCKGCGNRVPAGRETFCSNSCAEAAEPIEPAAAPPKGTAVPCKNPGCGKPVHQVRTHGGRKREYCSDSCRMKVKNAAQKERARARPAEPADLDMTPTPVTRRIPSPPAPTMPEQKVISLNVGISLTMDQIQTLNPGQIAALFEGLAMVLGAGK